MIDLRIEIGRSAVSMTATISLVGLGVARRLLSATPGPPVNPPHLGSGPAGLEMRLRRAATNSHNEQLDNKTLTEGVS